MSCGWENVLRSLKESGYMAMEGRFRDAAAIAFEQDRTTDGRALRLLAELCSMMLSASNSKVPFGPEWMLESRRSRIPDDLLPAEAASLCEFVPQVEHPWLKGRLAHVVWITSNPRDVRFALMTIDCYRSLPLTVSAWLHGGHGAWAQAIMLSKSLPGAVGNRLQAIEHDLVETALSSELGQDVPILPITRLLREHGLGVFSAGDIAPLLATCAQDIAAEGEPTNAAAYFKQAREWYGAADDRTAQIEMVVAEAESYVAEGQQRLHSEQPSALAAASWFNDAVKAYRKVPSAERSRFGIDERIHELRMLLSETRRESMNEFKTFETSTDISEAVTQIQDELRGHELPQSLKRFAALVVPPPYQQVVDEAKAIAEQTVFTKLFGVSHMSSDGRVVGHRDPSRPDNVEREEKGLEDDTFRHFQQTLGFIGACVIEPARRVISEEHQPTERYFAELAAVSPLVPPGRNVLFGKGLLAGFVGDYVTAAHLLTPQFEHLIRCAIASTGGSTTNLYATGVEHHKTLDTLLALPEAEATFGRDLFETLKAILCDPNGEGFRNQVAHGLLDDVDFPWDRAAFLWGIALSLAVRSLVFEGESIPDLRESEETAT